MEERFWKQKFCIAGWLVQWATGRQFDYRQHFIVCVKFSVDDHFTLNEIVMLILPVECGPSTIHTIIHNTLQLQKLSYRMVYLLHSDWWPHDKVKGVSLQFLTLYLEHSKDILDQVITGNNMWVHFFTPLTEH